MLYDLSIPVCSVRPRAVVLSCGAYLKTCNSKSACIIRQCGNRNNEGAIWDMLIIEFNGNFIVT